MGSRTEARMCSSFRRAVTAGAEGVGIPVTLVGDSKESWEARKGRGKETGIAGSKQMDFNKK